MNVLGLWQQRSLHFLPALLDGARLAEMTSRGGPARASEPGLVHWEVAEELISLKAEGWVDLPAAKIAKTFVAQ